MASKLLRPVRNLVSKGRQFLASRRALAKPAAGNSLFTDVALDNFAQILTSVPDPDQQLAAAGINRSQLKALTGDDEICAALDTRRDALLATPWRLEPGKGEDVLFVWEQLQAHMATVLRAAFDAVPYGYSVAEVVYSRLDGKRIGLHHVTAKPLHWFRPTQDGQLLFMGNSGGILANQPVDTQFKFLLTRRNPTWDNPYGEALLSRLYWAWYFRHNAWRFWMQFLERFGMPLLTGSSGDPAATVKAIQALGIETAIIGAKDDELTAHYASNSGEFKRVIDALGHRVQKLILGQTLTSEVGDKGSYAAAKVHNEVRDDKRVSDMCLCATTAQTLVNALWALNQFSGLPPTFVLADARGIEKERADRDKVLSDMGVEFSESYLYRAYDFEESEVRLPTAEERLAAQEQMRKAMEGPDDDEGGEGEEDNEREDREDDQRFAQLTKIAASIRAGDMPKETGKQILLAAAHPYSAEQIDAMLAPIEPVPLVQFARQFTPQQQTVEELVTAGVRKAGSPIDPALIRKAVFAAQNPEDLFDRLAILLRGEPSAAFTEALERALYAADVLGYTHAQEAAPLNEGAIRSSVERERDEQIFSALMQNLERLNGGTLQ